MSDRAYRPRTLYFPLTVEEWETLHEVRYDPELAPGLAEKLGRLLDALQERSDERYAMVVWSVDDVHNAAARLMGFDIDHGDEVPESAIHLDPTAVATILDLADSPIADLMTIHGWDVLESIVAGHLKSDS